MQGSRYRLKESFKMAKQWWSSGGGNDDDREETKNTKKS